MKIRFSKKAIDYSLVMLFIVIVSVPVLYSRMTSKLEDTKQTMGEQQGMLLRAPYDKEDTINYVEKAAQDALPNIINEIEQTLPGQTCEKTSETIRKTFNKHLDAYIKAFNQRSYTKIPENNYDIYIEGNKIHAIATMPVQKLIAKPGTQLNSIGTMWFAPSFTITMQTQKLTTAIETKKQACATI